MEGAGPIRSALQPDLVIVAVQVAPANPTRLRIRVANQGLAPAAESQIELTGLTAEGTVTRVAPIPMLRAGERHWFVLETGITLERLDGVTLEIDAPSRVVESDEGNNRYVYR